MERNHIYILEPYKGRKTRFVCPNCGKPFSFTRYINKITGERLPEEVGICNHKNNCGYQYTAGEYFRRNPYKRTNFKSEQLKNDPPKPPSFIPRAEMYKTVYKEDLVKNKFFTFLSNLIGEQSARNKVIDYNIGTTNHWPGANIFWQFDINDQVRTGKIMLFDSKTGKRVHGKENWVHSILHYPNFNLSQCLFGEHLLENWSIQNVGIVESEKTAIIASHYIPNMIWLATGGLGLFNPGTHPEKFKVLKEKTVILYPDLGIEKPNRETPYQEWTRKNEFLKILGVNSIVSDFLEKRATEQNRVAGEDIADFLIREHLAKGKKRVHDAHL